MFVYGIGRQEGPCKVGISKNPESRLRDLQPGCPFRIAVLFEIECRDYKHAYAVEQWFHYCHPDLQLCGEWFQITADKAQSYVKFSIADDSWRQS